MAWSITCSISKTAGASNTGRRYFQLTALLQAEGYEAWIAVRRNHKQHGGFLAVLLELFYALLEFGRARHRLLLDFGNHHPRREAFLGGGRVWIDAGDHDALHLVLDVVLLAQVVGEIGEIKSERLFHHGLFFGRTVFLVADRRLLFLILKPPKLDGLCLFFAFANDHHVDILADWRVGNDPRQVTHFLHVLAVKFDDDVARLDAGRFCRTFFIDAGDECTPRRLYAQALGDLVTHLLDAYAKPSAAHFLELTQLIDHRQSCLRGNGKSDTDRAAGWRNDRGVYTDHFAIHVEQRTARVAAIDRGVCLNVVVVRSGLDIAVARRNDPGGNRSTQAERIANGNYPFTEPQFFTVAEFDRLQRRGRLD